MMTKNHKGHCWVGVSGWNYPPWRKVFYPPGLNHSRELEYVSRQFNSLEVNGSFYGLLRPSTCRRWFDETPPDFLFALKGSRFITHLKRLRDVETPLANFFASGIMALGAKLGPILWQLPPAMAFDVERLSAFFDLLPRTTLEALRLAQRHDHRLEGRAHLEVDGDRPLRHALEIRHPSFVDGAFIRLLRRYQIALCVADTAGLFPFIEDVTADFVYVRLHGDQELYVSGYEESAIDSWAARIGAWRNGGELVGAVKAAPNLNPVKRKSRDVYVYFDNDARVRAPFDAQALGERLGLPRTVERPDLEGKGEPARTTWPAWNAVANKKKTK